MAPLSFESCSSFASLRSQLVCNEGTLSLLAQSSELVKEVNVHDTQIDWVLNINGRTVRSAEGKHLTDHIEELILLELAGVHARHDANVEPTFLILDGLISFCHSSTQIAFLERLQDLAGHAQVAVISPSPAITTATGSEWTITDLEYPPPSEFHVHDSPLDFEVETSTRPPKNPTSPPA